MRIYITIALIFFFNGVSQAPHKDCHLRKSGEGIEVYTCPMSDSKINSIQSNFTLNTTMDQLTEALIDLESFPKWQYKIVKTEMLKRISKTEFIYRAELETPWPVSNRDLILHVKLTSGPKAGEYQFSAIGKPNFIPPRNGFVRIPLSEAHWYITVVNPTTLKVKHSIVINPGGSIPTWLMNLSLAEGPYQTFKNLRGHLKTIN